MYANIQQKKKEINRIKNKNYRNNHLEYLIIHKSIFNRNNIHKVIINNLKTNLTDKTNIIQKLDTYSLGILIINILCQMSFKYNIPRKQLLKCFRISGIQNHMALLKDMTEYHSNNRIDIFTAYERYKSLLKLY